MATLQRNPLGEEDCACLNKVLENIPPALELANVCKECGWDTTEFIQQLQNQHAMATKAKASFFPNHP